VRDSERISAKVGKFQPSLTLKLKRLAQQRQEAGLPVYDFGLGETKGELAGHIRQAAKEAYDRGHTMYGDPAGLPELRQAVLEWLGLADHYTIDNVVITIGAKQSLMNMFLAICNPADCVLFDAAPWVSYQPLAVAASAFPIMVLPAAQESGHLKITRADLERNLRIRPDARLFLLNNPCNPTGQLYSKSEVGELVAECVEQRIYFVLDRLYWRLLFDGAEYPEPPVDETTRSWLIHVDGISKNFRRTGGLRIGWTVAPDDVAEAMVNLQSHYTSGPALPAQYGALAAIRHAYDYELRDQLQVGRDLLARLAPQLPNVRVWPTPATFYSFWDIRGCLGRVTPGGRLLDSSEEVAEYLLDRAGVVTAPGSAFLQEGYLRVSFAVPAEELERGLEAAREALAALALDGR
jgi:aspartate aminotransferase